MKTKNLILKSFIAILFAGFIIAGCKKKEVTTPAPPPVTTTNDGTPEQTQRACDQSNTGNESNQVMDDANSAMGGVSTTRGVQQYCNMTIDSSQKAIGKLILNYNGPDCFNTKNRTGSIEIQLPYNSVTQHVTRWSVAGATATITFVNYKVTYLSNNKSITFNGTHSMTNVNGGGVIQLYLGTPIIHKIRANMQLTFDDSTSRTWRAAEIQTLSSVSGSGQVKATIIGDTTMGGHSNVAFWGINRMGDSFIVDNPTPFSYNVYGFPCLFKPLTGVFIYYGITHSITLTYGVDSNGNIVTAGCPTSYKFSWLDAQGATQQVVLPY